MPTILRTGRRPVIFSRFAGLGDIICSIPAARAALGRHPGATFIYNCDAAFASVPRLAGVADRITSLKPIGVIGHWYRFLLGGFYHFANGDDTTDPIERGPMVAEFCRQFGLPVVEEHPAIEVSAEARARALAILAEANLDASTLVLIHPGPSYPVREWPNEKWASLVQELRRHGFADIGQLGVSHYSLFGKVDVPVIPGAISLLDRLTIEECFAVIAQARLFVGIDSALLHIAACTRTPAVGIFGMTLPDYRFSREFRQDFVTAHVDCLGCEHHRPKLHWITGCPYDIKCMKTLEEKEVLQACLHKLSAGVNQPEIPQTPANSQPH